MINLLIIFFSLSIKLSKQSCYRCILGAKDTIALPEDSCTL